MLPRVNGLRLIVVEAGTAPRRREDRALITVGTSCRARPRAGAARPDRLDAAAAGEVLRITDIQGQQVADLVCFNRHDTGEKLSVHATMMDQGSIYIGKGRSLLSNQGNSLMTLVEDTCGVHDLLAGSCNEGSNFRRYGVHDTPNCRSNLEAALAPHGIPPAGDPVQLQRLHERPCWSRTGASARWSPYPGRATTSTSAPIWTSSSASRTVHPTRGRATATI